MRVPKDWNKIPLKNFVHYLEYIEEEPESIEDRFDLLYKRTCAILDCNVEEAKALSIEDQQKLVKLMRTKLPTRLMLGFKFKGVRYRPTIQAKKLTGARYTAIKDIAKRGSAKNLHHILFLICQPVKFGFKKSFPFIGWKPFEWEAEQMEDKIKEFKELPMEIANPISLFFLNLSANLRNLLDDYSIQTLKKMTDQMAELQADLENDTDG